MPCVWWNSSGHTARATPSSVTAPTTPCAAKTDGPTPTTVCDARPSVRAGPSSPSSTRGRVVSGPDSYSPTFDYCMCLPG